MPKNGSQISAAAISPLGVGHLEDAVRDADFLEGGIGGEVDVGAELALPAEAADDERAALVEVRDPVDAAVDPRCGRVVLVGDDRGFGDRFDKAGTQRGVGDPLGDDERVGG